MKTFKTLLLPFLFISYLLLSSIYFQSCKPDDCEEEEFRDTFPIALKPNIYIYPEEESFLSITLEFPKGGRVIASIPEYGNGWSFSVNPEGIIDNDYEFLFYESSQPDVWQIKKGWCINKAKLSEFFTSNLREFGFVGREIEDFNDYWVPRFQTSEYYCFYPQDKSILDRVIEINVSTEPDNILRLFYLVEESVIDKSTSLLTPEIEEFSRDGFYITEWGVILK